MRDYHATLHTTLYFARILNRLIEKYCRPLTSTFLNNQVRHNITILISFLSIKFILQLRKHSCK